MECCMSERKWGAFAADVAISMGPEWICVRSQSPGNPPGRDTVWIECEVKNALAHTADKSEHEI